MFKTALRPSSKGWRCAFSTTELGEIGSAPLVLSTHSRGGEHSTQCHLDLLLSGVIHIGSREEGTMRTKLMLEALAAWLALAAVSGLACASIQTGANRVFGANSVLTMVADPEASPDEITRPYQEG